MNTGIVAANGESAMGEWVEQHKVQISISILALTVVGLAVAWVLSSRPEPIVILTPAPTSVPAPTATDTPALVRVYVSGAVESPDVYVLTPGALVKDAIAAAGGATDEADLVRVNLALEVVDQQQVHVPCEGETPVPGTLPDRAVTVPLDEGPININLATIEQLETLPGIGPAFAERIVAYRTEYGPFETVQEIMDVRGIGPATLAKFEDQITVK